MAKAKEQKSNTPLFDSQVDAYCRLASGYVFDRIRELSDAEGFLEPDQINMSHELFHDRNVEFVDLAEKTLGEFAIQGMSFICNISDDVLEEFESRDALELRLWTELEMGINIEVGEGRVEYEDHPCGELATRHVVSWLVSPRIRKAPYVASVRTA